MKSKLKLCVPDCTLLFSRIISLAVVYFLMVLVISLSGEKIEIAKFIDTDIRSGSFISVIKFTFRLWILGSLISIFVAAIKDLIGKLMGNKLAKSEHDNGTK